MLRLVVGFCLGVSCAFSLMLIGNSGSRKTVDRILKVDATQNQSIDTVLEILTMHTKRLNRIEGMEDSPRLRKLQAQLL